MTVYTLERNDYVQYEMDNTSLIAVSHSIDTLKALATEHPSVFDEQWTLNDKGVLSLSTEDEYRTSITFYITEQTVLD